MSRVLEDIKSDSDAARKAESNGVNGKEKEKEGRGEKGVSLALPKGVVDEGLKVTRECLELVCEVHE
jgi:hypothetical protein